MRISYLWRNCFLLLIPILVVNIACAEELPPAFQPNVFWADIPPEISIPENTLRLLVIVIPVFFPLSLSSKVQRAGFALFCGGSLVYFASWAALILAPLSSWSTSAIGFIAPATTPLIWLAGLTLLGDRLVFSRIRYRRWMYGSLVAAFIAFHFAHAFLIWHRIAA